MAPQRSVSMDRMWYNWRETFPNSNRAQDGWIGDLEHASGTSGHNPDDTPGVSAERQDADTKQEVRAVDKDVRLNAPGVTMEQIVQRMLQTPNDLKRLIYIIYNRRIWKKSNGWRKETYTGSDPHDMHAHFSGDPAYDEDGSTWTSITSFGGSSMTTLDTVHISPNGESVTLGTCIARLYNQDYFGLEGSTSFPQATHAKLNKILQILGTLGDEQVPPFTQEQINTAVKLAFQDPTVTAALANAINDDAAARLAE